ncbi:MAG: alpha/beta hydrolase [Hyphomicrobiaceae bacterium]
MSNDHETPVRRSGVRRFIGFLSYGLTALVLVAAVVLIASQLESDRSAPTAPREIVVTPEEAPATEAPAEVGEAAPEPTAGAAPPVAVTEAAPAPAAEPTPAAPPPELEAAAPAPDIAASDDIAAKSRADTFGDADAPFTIVKVYYATDRKPTGESDPNQKYGGDRGTLVLGEAEVSIPRDHRLGELEAPSIWKLEFTEDPEKHVVLQKASEVIPEVFYKSVREKVAAAPDKSAFIFIHGYNVLFKDAARRTAQMTYDLGFPGAPVFYSWPSQGTTLGYTVDENNIQWTQANLKKFIKDFADQSQAENIYLVAHSMGNRALTGAVKELVQESPDIRNRFKEIILAAPDIDAEIFKRDIAPYIVTATPTVTLYASSNDKALIASKEVHGYARAGDSGSGLVIVNGVDTIDSTNAETDFVGHTYYASSKSIIADIFNLIHRRLRPDKRPGLKGVDEKDGRYWEFLGVDQAVGAGSTP